MRAGGHGRGAMGGGRWAEGGGRWAEGGGRWAGGQKSERKARRALSRLARPKTPGSFRQPYPAHVPPSRADRAWR
ncbi:MAG TPA: hypothetical protein EYQ66_01980 [Myxococcales bacterium]|nr:hypothetical protein [Myxococcales bacterium]